MATFTGTFSVGLMAGYTSSADLTTPQEIINILLTEAYTSGTGSSQSNAFWSDTRELIATSENIDLEGSVISDSFGVALNFTKIRGLIIRNKATTTGYDLTIGGDFLRGASITTNVPIQTLAPGGVLVKTSPIDGITVTSGTGNTININAGSNTISYDLILWGIV